MQSLSATDDYLSLLTSIPNLTSSALLSLFFLTLARLLPIVSLSPFFGSRNVPGTIRILVSLSLLAIFLPQNILLAKGELGFTIAWMLGLVKEILIGFILGFLASVPFYTAQMAGTLVDFQRGASSLQVSDPTTQSQTGPIGMLCNWILIAIFYTLGGPFLYLDAIASSYELFPVDQGFPSALFQVGLPFWDQIFSLVAMMLKIATQLGAPALIGVLLTDLFLGIANRLAPQVQIVFLGMALKSWVGLALLTAAWLLMLKVMGVQSIEWIKTLQSFFTAS